MNTLQNRRDFIKTATSVAALSFLPMGGLFAGPSPLNPAPRPKKRALVRGAFFYPPANVVLAGKAEDNWSKHEWFTWPGNQFAPEEQQKKFVAKVREMTAGLDLDVVLDDTPLHTEVGIRGFMASVEQTRPAALLLFNFWNSFSPKLKPILEAWNGPAIIYHPVGANHQLPPEYLRTAPRVSYIHSIENWSALEQGLRAVHAVNRLAQSRLLRVSGQAKTPSDTTEPFFGVSIHTVPAAEFNTLYDELKVTREMEAMARTVRRQARRVTDLAPGAFTDAARSHGAVQQLMQRHDADAIAIECLFLKHRKPCLSFAVNNGNLVPCGCENDLNASLTLMLGASLFGRGGFQHNPEFDTEQNLYFGSHCTCTNRLHGPAAKPEKYDLRPFFHQMPKTLALDVQWSPGEPVTLCKYLADQKILNAWQGTVIDSPACPPTGGCATRVLVKLENVADVCSVYSGPHPVLYCGDFARHCRTLSKLYPLDLRTNLV